MTYAAACRLADSLRAPRKDPFVELAARRAALPTTRPATEQFRSALGADGRRHFFDSRGRSVARKDLPRWIRDMTAGEFAHASMPRYVDLPGSWSATGSGITFS